MRSSSVVACFALLACTSSSRAPVAVADSVTATPEIVAPPSPRTVPAAPHAPVTRCPPAPSPTNVAEPMTFRAFVAELAARIDALDVASVEAEVAPVAGRHGLDARNTALLHDFARIRTLFEATRDGGFWRIRWAITNQEPSSKRIWSQWSKGDLAAFDGASATAECDEISALTSFLARKLGVERVGLFYPTWNHTIAAWEPLVAGGKTVKRARVLLPTTQIFLECTDAIDATTFSESAQKTVFPYAPKDVSDAYELSAKTASFLLAQVDGYARAPRDVLALIRLHRARLLDSSVGDCATTRADLANALDGKLGCAGEAALARYWTTELGQVPAEPAVVLRALGSSPTIGARAP